MKSLLCSLLLFALALGLSACGSREPPAGKGPATTEAPPAQLAAWKIELRGPDQVVADKPLEFTANVKEASGQPVAGAVVEISLKMKTMDMGENKARLTEQAPGVYSGKATFTMTGTWEVEVRATKGSLTAVEHFPYTVKEAPAGK
jgi:nitrogen fixation protein FixH